MLYHHTGPSSILFYFQGSVHDVDDIIGTTVFWSAHVSIFCQLSVTPLAALFLISEISDALSKQFRALPSLKSKRSTSRIPIPVRAPAIPACSHLGGLG